MKKKIFLVLLLATTFIGLCLWNNVYKIKKEIIETQKKLNEIDNYSKQLEKQIRIFDMERSYREVTKRGDGITHLARRALHRMLKQQNLQLTREQRIYAEDYLTKCKIKELSEEVSLQIGKTISFEESLLLEAVCGSLNADVNNLTQFTKKVDWKKYEVLE